MPFNLAHLGEGLAAGLEKAAHNRLEEKLRQDEIQKNMRLWKLIKLPTGESLPEETVRAISEQSPEFQKEAFKSLGLGGAGFGSQSNPMQSMTGLGEPQAQQQPSPQQAVSGKSMATQAAQRALQEPQVAPQPVATAQPSGGKSLGRIFTIGKASGQNGEDASERRHKESLAQKKELAEESLAQKKELAEDEAIAPFLRGQAEDFNSAQRIYNKASGMLKILKENKKDWPGWLESKKPIDWHRNPHVRKYIADAGSLVSEIASSRKGQPTNFKIKLEQESKPELSQPYETQVALLEDLIQGSQKVFSIQKRINDIKKANNGRIPSDVRQKLIEEGIESLYASEGESDNKPKEFSIGQELDELPDASKVPVGMELESGKDTLISDGKTWKKKK